MLPCPSSWNKPCYQTLLIEYWICRWKCRHAQMFNFNLPFWHNCWTLLLFCLEKHALINILISAPVHLPTLVAQLHLVPVKLPQLPTCRNPLGSLCPISHMDGWLYFLSYQVPFYSLIPPDSHCVLHMQLSDSHPMLAIGYWQSY